MIQTTTLKEALKDPGGIEVVEGIIAKNILIQHWAELDSIFWYTTTSLKRYTISSADDYNSEIHPYLTGSIQVVRIGGGATAQIFTGLDRSVHIRVYNPSYTKPEWSLWSKI